MRVRKVIKTMALVAGATACLTQAPAGAAGMLELEMENVPTVLGVAVAPMTTPSALPPCSATPLPGRSVTCNCWRTN